MNIATSPAHINEQIRQALAVEGATPPAGATIPFWRNFYTLHVKTSSTSAPITKMIYQEGGFTTVKAFCELYCEKMNYRFLTLCPMFSDLKFEMTGENSFVTNNNKEGK